MKQVNLLPSKIRGFALLESLIAVLVVSIAFLGMVALMIHTQEARTGRQHLLEAVKLTNAKMSQLSHVDFSLLATGTTPEEKMLWGAPNEEVVVSGSLNARGQEDDGQVDPPFMFTRSFVVCLDDQEGGADASSQDGNSCGDITSARPFELTCDTTETEEKQAIIRVLTTYRDRHGKCHKTYLEKVAVDYN